MREAGALLFAKAAMAADVGSQTGVYLRGMREVPPNCDGPPRAEIGSLWAASGVRDDPVRPYPADLALRPNRPTAGSATAQRCGTAACVGASISRPPTTIASRDRNRRRPLCQGSRHSFADANHVSLYHICHEHGSLMAYSADVWRVRATRKPMSKSRRGSVP